MIEEIQQDASLRMRKTVDSTRGDMAKIRTGRATVSLLDHLTVEYYGTVTPVNQVATISVSDARTLVVQPWEKNMISAIEKSILESGLGLNPVTAGEFMRLPLPPMTEERRIGLGKVVKQVGENGKIAIRNIRRDAIHMVRDLLKEKEITQDEEKTAESTMQDLTDKYIRIVEQVVVEKEKEVMEV